MKYLSVFIFLLSLSFNAFTQQQDADLLRGPYNGNKAPGIVDGVVVSNEVPIRSKVEYEHVRLADYVWSKRVFSRIDAREKMNHDLFYPFDEIHYGEPIFAESFSKTFKSEHWVKHEGRYSLWTIILKHILKGDVRIFSPYDLKSGLPNKVRDGYQFKYPITSIRGEKSAQDIGALYDPVEKAFFGYVVKSVSNFQNGKGYKFEGSQQQYTAIKTNEDVEQVLDSQSSSQFILTSLAGDDYTIDDMYRTATINKLKWTTQIEVFRKSWAASEVGKPMVIAPTINLLTSQAIVAYNIKEDWFFDKERSILDKRIIAIAPVANYIVQTDDNGNPTNQADAGNICYVDSKSGQIFNQGSAVTKPTFQTEMFWMYFPQLRDIMVNYFTYNDRSDAQWSSFDDLFWKRKFKGQIYKTSDKFDRDIQDYRFGVDALYEAEKVKGEIRKWEHDVWNY